MCGRYKLTANEKWLSFLFNLDPEDVAWVNRWEVARWNIAPTQEVATIRQHSKEPKRIFNLMKWGLVPSWAKDVSFGPRQSTPCQRQRLKSRHFVNPCVTSAALYPL